MLRQTHASKCRDAIWGLSTYKFGPEKPFGTATVINTPVADAAYVDDHTQAQGVRLNDSRGWRAAFCSPLDQRRWDSSSSFSGATFS